MNYIQLQERAMRVLLVEDDEMLGSAVQKHLGHDGFAVDWITSGKDFTEAVNCHTYDFVILDLGLPDMPGEVLLQRLHSAQMDVRVIVTTARGSISDRVSLLNKGADDFLVKPYDLDELTARIRSLLRRLPIADADANASSHGPLRLFPLRLAATWDGVEVPLTHREFWVLETLVRCKNQVLSRHQIEESLYGWGEEVESNAIEVYVHMLRRKFRPDLIHTIRGVGYKIAPV
jgi:DNA-binding response OmpR family regulator